MWLCWVLVAGHGMFFVVFGLQLQHVDSVLIP